MLTPALAEYRFNPNHTKNGQFGPGHGGGLPSGEVAVSVGKKHSFAQGVEHGSGKTVTNFKGTVARKAADGRLMVNAGTNAKPRWVETHAKHAQASPQTAKASTGDSKRNYASRLTEGEKKAIEAYQSEFYKSINGSLRSDKPLSKVTAKRIADLDSAVAKGTIEKDTTLYRAFHIDAHPDSLVGKEFIDKGFVSTSEGTTLPLRMASSKKGGIFARIKAPTGTNAGYLHKVSDRQSISKYDGVPEKEVLLGRGSRFNVTNARQDKDGMWTVDMELIPG